MNSKSKILGNALRPPSMRRLIFIGNLYVIYVHYLETAIKIQAEIEMQDQATF